MRGHRRDGFAPMVEMSWAVHKLQPLNQRRATMLVAQSDAHLAAWVLAVVAFFEDKVRAYAPPAPASAIDTAPTNSVVVGDWLRFRLIGEGEDDG